MNPAMPTPIARPSMSERTTLEISSRSTVVRRFIVLGLGFASSLGLLGVELGCADGRSPKRAPDAPPSPGRQPSKGEVRYEGRVIAFDEEADLAKALHLSGFD